MKIMTWNVRNASYESIKGVIRSFRPDLLVLAEVREPSVADQQLIGASDSRWRGNPGKGLAVFTFDGLEMFDGPAQPDPPPRFSAGPDTDLKQQILPWVLPVEVDIGLKSRLRFIGAWPSNRHDFRPLNEALVLWHDWLAAGPVIVAGDFNNHWRWDRKKPGDRRNHSYTEQLLDEHNLVSVFHAATGITKGDQATEPATFWRHYRHELRYHIDFIYAPRPCVVLDPPSVTIGRFEDFTSSEHRLSDHAPLMCEIFQPADGRTIGCTFGPSGPIIVEPYWQRGSKRAENGESR